MILVNETNQAQKCFRCKTMVAATDNSYNCIYCSESYCPSCLGYTKFFDMDELEALINQFNQH